MIDKPLEMKTTTIILEKDLYTAIRHIAAGKDIKFNDAIKEALADYAKKNPQYVPKK